MARLLAILALMLGFATTASSQEDGGLRKLLTTDASRGWQGVGRLDLAGTMFCTGSLVAPDLVLTAAHCLFDPEDGTPIPASDILFRAGYRMGQSVAERRAVEAVGHPDFDPLEDRNTVRVAHDVALIRLSQPIRNISVKPFPIGERPRKGDEVAVVSYGHDRTESPALQEQCRVMARQSGALILTCEAEEGSSGAPVFALSASGQPEIVSVISALANSAQRQVTLGTNLHDSLEDLMNLVSTPRTASSTSGTPRVFSLSGEKESGAKFVRP